VFNWTATYRRDSDIVAPYERWAYYDERVKQNPRFDHNYAANKTKKVKGLKCNTDYIHIYSSWVGLLNPEIGGWGTTVTSSVFLQKFPV
jgi:hypothetical protein